MTELLLHDFLTVALGVRVCSELPADLGDVLPVVQATRIGGPHDDNDPLLQTPTVDIDYFAADRAAAFALAEAGDLALRRQLPGATVGTVRVGMVRTLSGPSWRGWDNTSIRRVGATYQLWIKPTA